jgi:hypothetical protein
MKEILYAQFNPTKTLPVFLRDREIFRMSILGAMLLAFFL